MFHFLLDKIMLLKRTYSEHEARDSEQRLFKEVSKRYIQNYDQKINFDDSDDIEIKVSYYGSFKFILKYIWWLLHSNFLFMNTK